MNDFQSKRLHNYISRENFSRTFKEKVAAITCHKNSKIKMLRESEAANCWKGRKIHLKMHLIEQKS